MRQALVNQVLGGLEGRIVVVSAGAGYGKSTLLAQALDEAGDSWVWLTLDPRIAEPGQVLAHLAAGLAERVPGFGARLELAGPPEAQLAALSNEIAETVLEDVLLVLDDAHVLAGTPAAGLPAELARDLPTHVHLALAGRNEPALPRGRLVADAQLVEIGEEALMLSESESAALLAGAGFSLSGAQVAELPAAHRGLGRGAAPGRPLGRGGGPRPQGREGGALFAYLAEEVVDRQPPGSRSSSWRRRSPTASAPSWPIFCATRTTLGRSSRACSTSTCS